MYFRLTLFNGITLFVAALTILAALARRRFKPDSNWFVLYYVLILAFWYFLPGSLDAPWVVGGVAAGIAMRFEFLGGIALTLVRTVEYVFFAYVLWRCVALILMLPW